VIDLENKLKESDMKYAELQKELKNLEQIEKSQQKELDKLTQNRESSNKIQELTEQLKKAKEKNKELEKKIQADAASYQKQHVSLLDLQEKLQKLKEEKAQWKKAIAEKQAGPGADKETKEKKSEEEILKNSIRSLRKRIEIERANSRKATDGLKTELAQLQTQIKEAEQENKLNVAKLKELKPMLRHNQLKPIADPPGPDQEAKANDDVPPSTSNEIAPDVVTPPSTLPAPTLDLPEDIIDQQP
jgi:chromosome segregation ATPase